MKDKDKKEQNYKNPKKEIINFINSIDYINEDITQNKNFNFYQLNNEIFDIDLNLSPYIEELNNLLKNDKKSIKNEIELFE
jgi:hypothetical protein